MIDNFEYCLSVVLENEGGWSDHPRDPGGATMKGVTLKTFRAYFGQDLGKDDLRNITDDQIQYIYKKGYWNMAACDKLPSGVDLAVFDYTVNSGYIRAVRHLQECVECSTDGIVGPNTLMAVLSNSPSVVIRDLCRKRLDFLKKLSTWRTFGNGWERRVRHIKDLSLELVKNNGK